MNKNKQILKHCPNFYKIMNFEYYEDDLLSDKLINVYHDYVFKVSLDDKKNIAKLEQVDFIINKYIEVFLNIKLNINKILDIIILIKSLFKYFFTI